MTKCALINILTAGAVLTGTAAAAPREAAGAVATSGCSVSRNGEDIEVRVDFILDSLRLDANRQIYVSPVISSQSGKSVALPSLLVNGRNMQFALERGVIKAADTNHPEIYASVRRDNGKPQTISYLTRTPLESWMLAEEMAVSFPVDTCGCGIPAGSGNLPSYPFTLNPVAEMTTAYITPQVTALPVSIHEGKARVQFEVDRTELHPAPYVCRNGQRIDNRRELQVIDDSISYALTDPNVEIAEISICGYASPESPYTHNDMLATGRSRALAEYIADRHHLPREVCSYSAVPENWVEFRQIVETAPEITEQQRADLLELIDAPAYGPSDYDAKEKTLKTDPKFAKLYKDLILPVWFPKLRATKFEIKTRLKPLPDEKLAEVILQTPEKMSLNQMFRVANLYAEGSEQFDKAIEIALESNPGNEVASLNAAVSAYNSGDFEKAEALVKDAGASPEAENLRGILATRRGDFEGARRHFEAAKPLPEAIRNLEKLK